MSSTRHRARRALVSAAALATVLSLAVVAPASADPVLDCGSDAAHSHVCNGYDAYVRRIPAQAELDHWAHQTPFPRTQFNRALGRSAESRRATIRDYYRVFGGYTPSNADVAYWDAQILQPNGLRRLEAGLLGSYVGMIDGFLSKTFDLELGRSPSPAESDYWGTRTAQTSRTRVAAEISNTLEGRRAKVVFAHHIEVGTPLPAAVRDQRAELLRTGTSYLELRIILRSSTMAAEAACVSPAPRIGEVCD